MHEAGTSVTADDCDYLSIARQAAADQKLFQNFRTHPVYVRVLEHVNRDQGAGCLAEARRKFSGGQIRAWAGVNDAVGGPTLSDYGQDVGRVSPVTLRYIKVAADLLEIFGSLRDLKVVEIGAGYGGQCRVVLSVEPTCHYTMVDLASAGQITARFLAETKAAADRWRHVRYEDSKTLAKTEFDLVVSNYAFSECTAAVRQHYLDTLIKRTPRGYMIINHFSDAERAQLVAELTVPARIVKILPEIPLTGDRNCLVVWWPVPSPRKNLPTWDSQPAQSPPTLVGLASASASASPSISPSSPPIAENSDQKKYVSVQLEGGLGNQMFQISACAAFAKQTGRRAVVEKTNKCGERPVYWTSMFSRLQSIGVGVQPTSEYSGIKWDREVTMRDPPGYTEWPKTNSDASLLLHGFFQSPKFFARIAPEVRRCFAAPAAFVKTHEAKVGNAVALHVRRTDYVAKHSGVYVQLPASYYHDALKKFAADSTVVVFSDDSEWCRRNLDLRNRRVMFAADSGLTDVEELWLMSLCRKGVVMANSTFSWWGAYLADPLVPVVAPRSWFHARDFNDGIQSIFCDHWTLWPPTSAPVPFPEPASAPHPPAVQKEEQQGVLREEDETDTHNEKKQEREWDEIDKVYYVNLDECKDRRKEVEDELKRLAVPDDKIHPITAKDQQEQGVFQKEDDIVIHNEKTYESVWDEIDMVYYINLDERKDRRKEIEDELKRLGVPDDKMHRIAAVKDVDGWIGCMISHIKVCEHMLAHGFRHVLVVEDDAKARTDVRLVCEQVSKFLATSLRSKYTVCMLAWNPKGVIERPVAETKVVVEAGDNSHLTTDHGTTTAGFLLSRRGAGLALIAWQDAVRQALAMRSRRELVPHWILAPDMIWKSKVPDKYCFTPRLCSQRASFSDCSKRMHDESSSWWGI